MRKIVMMSVVSIGALLAAGGSASAAESIVGTWMGVGASMGGGRYVSTLRFYPNGAFLHQMATAGPTGSSAYTCQGTYQYDGRTLVTRVSACSPPEWTQYVQPTESAQLMFNGPYSFTLGDTTYRRQ